MPAELDAFAVVQFVVCSAVERTYERLMPTCLTVANGRDAKIVLEFEGSALLERRVPPYPTGPTALTVTIDAQILLGSHLALGWPLPARVIDLLIEFRQLTNGRVLPIGAGLRGALAWFGLATGPVLEHASTAALLRDRLDAVVRLAQAMLPSIDAHRAVLRGRYLCAVARMEATGVPVDEALLRRVAEDWPVLRHRAVDVVGRAYGIDRTRHFDPGAFSGWLDRHGIDWPRTPAGALDLSDDTFREMARTHPSLRPLKDLRSLSSFDPRALAIGCDGRNRAPLRPFASRTGRNQPSAKASMLGVPAWARHLIKPNVGTGLAMIDWRQQEFGIAAALSGDPEMQAAYASGDPYLALAIAAGAAPPTATAQTHADLRERYKACALGMQYGMGAERLARQIALPLAEASDLIHQHRTRFRSFWCWLEAIESDALLRGEQTSVFGWRLAIGACANPRAIRNFPMQANGAEMLRLACCLVTEAGIAVCAPNHDALLIEASLEKLDDAVTTTRRLMADASAIVLDGFGLETSVRTCRAPNRWVEPRGEVVWSAILQALDSSTSPDHQSDATCSSADTRSIYLYVSNEDPGHDDV